MPLLEFFGSGSTLECACLPTDCLNNITRLQHLIEVGHSICSRLFLMVACSDFVVNKKVFISLSVGSFCTEQKNLLISTGTVDCICCNFCSSLFSFNSLVYYL